MAARWTEGRVLALAPDPGAARAARALARPGTWSALGSNESLVWGRCQGSAREPYQVTVDLNEPAFRCTCPSRKFPCKHGLALLLLWSANDGAVADLGQAADFAADWAHARAERAGRAARGGSAPDPEARARRIAERESLMSAGLDEFERWLFDLVRQGLAGVRGQPAGYWETAAARLVDAQVPGLAERVRAMGSAVHARDDWAPYLLARLGRWYLAVRAWRARATLPPATLGDLRAVLGWSRRSEEVLAGERVRDRWWVLGLRQDEDDRLLSQRTWLHGEESGETVVLLDFAAAGGSLRVPHVLGSVLDGELALYPGSAPRRVLPAGEHAVSAGDGLPVADTVLRALDLAAGWQAGNPWLDRVPMALGAVTVVPDGDGAVVVDRDGTALPMAPEVAAWPMLALTGGHPVDLFGEWAGERLYPCSIAVDGTLVSV